MPVFRLSHGTYTTRARRTAQCCYSRRGPGQVRSTYRRRYVKTFGSQLRALTCYYALQTCQFVRTHVYVLNVYDRVKSPARHGASPFSEHRTIRVTTDPFASASRIRITHGYRSIIVSHRCYTAGILFGTFDIESVYTCGTAVCGVHTAPIRNK